MVSADKQPVANQFSKIKPFHVLLAYDGSEHAQAAVQLMLALSRGAKECMQDCHITLLAVLPTQYIAGHEALELSLERESKLMQKEGMQVSSEIKAGNPADTINNYAQELQVDLIVIGAKGLRATMGILLGGVAQQVVEYSSCPVLVVRAPFKGINRLLMVADGSTHSLSAARYLCLPSGAARGRRFPIPPSSEITVLHVLPPSIPDEAISRAWTVGPEVLYPAPVQPIDREIVEAREEDSGKRILEEITASLSANGLEASGILRRGDAATEIIEFVKEKEIDLIIGGSRGLSQVAGWLLGSVSRKLVHYAGCSILIVK